jgi:hypothetical protein
MTDQTQEIMKLLKTENKYFQNYEEFYRRIGQSV